MYAIFIAIASNRKKKMNNLLRSSRRSNKTNKYVPSEKKGLNYQSLYYYLN